MITLTTSTNHARRETTVTAKTAAGHFLCAETWVGTGARVAVALAQHVRRSAENLERRLNIAQATSSTQARLLAERL
ncbi:hypothetical protein [Hymenobacter cellulosivorans]|uniref:Uncharacterized protein n=1 Tax=Hymenobacter cellulosivorans TaxID=2932249 RepID=A0ABY4F989_9BACT|nr:hypothetical protein [Hymenobacter cellulosivorans]UOQ53085.1 hypothetical protein MUN80_25525 [Hymenobacter cellulosivorans]